MIEARKEGRNLVLIMEGLDPFVIKPLPGEAGIQITDAYLNSINSEQGQDSFTDALIMAVEGARKNGITGRWEPIPGEDRIHYPRFANELSQEESEQIVMPAFFWQTILGLSGVQEYIKAGGGLPGTLKASGALSSRLALLARTTSPSSA